ncbi:regulation of cell cycle [Stemphylium lycopersici]|uniref:Regulation of cell cycle n=1 Tax=Stemphylium lycopersici TaxID=183478 RepID=A0A364NGR7_STELY|nr:regulation of cell cycle [Stemphylium lycopersici]RAR16291.1 regulation of cell cycle [Stemphylium lycopersici]
MSKPKDLPTLIDLTKTTQALLIHYQSSLAPTKNAAPPAPDSTEIADPLAVLKSTATLLRSHTTTLSLLLINPPLTPSALISKIGDVSSGPLSGMVAAASYVPREGQKGDIGDIMRAEVKIHVKGLLGSWGDVLGLIVKIAEKNQKASKRKEAEVTEADKQEVLSTTGVVWEACDALLKLCTDGVVGLVVKKAHEFREVLLDAIEELKEWGEDVADDDDDDDEAAGSDDEDEIFGAENKLGKDDKELKELLDNSVKKLKMVGMLYQALTKRRLKTYPASSTLEPTAAATNGATSSPCKKLDELMRLLKTIPETVDDVAGAFYDLDEDEAKQELDKCCGQAQRAIELMSKSWTGEDDEFTAWSGKWLAALGAA